jgi:hypothetical protein
MREIKEVLRLRFELRLGQRAIARACSISQSTVHEYLNRAATAGVVWPLGEEWDEQRIEQALFGERQVVKRLPEQVLPDFPDLHSQLQQHRHLTLQLAWVAYRQVHPEGYGYSRFCELYQRWRRKQDVVLRQVHQPGEKGFVDSAGATTPVHDPVTGEIWPASLFVMVLGASSYTYAEATRDPCARNAPNLKRLWQSEHWMTCVSVALFQPGESKTLSQHPGHSNVIRFTFSPPEDSIRNTNDFSEQYPG